MIKKDVDKWTKEVLLFRFFIFITAVWCALFLAFIIREIKTVKKKTSEIELIQNKNQKLKSEKAALELKISNYVLFSDSITKVIETNKNLSNEKIKSLIHLKNDELRQIAND